MSQKIGFDTERYLSAQTAAILKRIKQFDKKLYLEFGGKLCYDSHAARVLPGYQPDAKLQMFKRLKKDLEIIYCIGAKDLQKGKIALIGLTYDQQALKDINELHENGIYVSAVVITRFENEPAAKRFKQQLENLGIKVYLHGEIKGYPNNIDLAVSEQGYGSNPFVKTTKPLVIVTGAGGGSGKMSFCLSQIYHENKRGVRAGFAKFETFPIWGLPVDHPVNVAYESSTADLGDKVVIDTFHLKAYKIKSSSYNRDMENFVIMMNIFSKIAGKENPVVDYKSPTDMGVNMAKEGIINDKIVREASKQEIIRRYFQYKNKFIEGVEPKETVERAEELMKKVRLKPEDRKVVLPARKAEKDAEKSEKGHKGVYCGAAIELPNGKIVTGKNSPLLHAESAAILNAIKELANIPDKIDMLPKNVIDNIADMKKDLYGNNSESLNVEEAMVTLAISVSTNPTAATGIRMLKQLKGCEMHTTHMLTKGDESGLRKLGINVTTDAKPTLKYSK